LSTKSIIQALGLLIALLVAAPLASLGATPVGAGHTGHWFVPTRSGEGWVLEILDPQRALVYWFTYDDAGKQRWLVGEGKVAGNRIEFPEMVVTSGGRKFFNFDPTKVVREVVGSLSLDFDDCDSGSVTYDAFGVSQTLPISRLTATSGLGCGGGEAGMLPVWQTGSWFDPANDGEGFSLHWTAAGEPLLSWFSYDQQGAQRWIMGVGQRIEGQLIFEDLIHTAGGRFGPAFDPATVRRIPWGKAALTMDCESGVFAFESEERSGRQAPQRLAPVYGLGCPAPGIDLERARWAMESEGAPPLSLVASAQLADSAYVVGGLADGQGGSQFWRFDLNSRTWSRLADLPTWAGGGMLVAHDGTLIFIGGGGAAMRYSPMYGLWEALPPLPKAVEGGAAVSLGGHVYVIGGRVPYQGIATVQQLDVHSLTWSSYDVPGLTGLYDFKAVAYEGKIWVLGGDDRFDGAWDRVDIFDPIARQAVSGPGMKQARSRFSATVVDGRILVAGGVYPWSPHTTGSVEVYSSQEGQWREIAPLATPVIGAGFAAFQNRVYLLLGASLQPVGDTGLVQALQSSE
jgi:hypothetical protein